MFVRHRVQILVHLRQQSDTIFPDQPSRLVSVLVILESMIDRQSRHSNVDNRFGWIALGIALQNGPILERSSREQNDVHVVMKFRFGGSKPPAFTTTHSMSLQSTTTSREAVLPAFLLFRPLTSDLCPSVLWSVVT